MRAAVKMGQKGRTFRSAAATRNLTLYTPRNEMQKRYRTMLTNESPDIVIAVGPAGTSKTFGALLVGLEKLRNREIDKIMITRPIVPADNDLGFLPGTLDEKMKVWIMPFIDTLQSCMSTKEVQAILDDGSVQTCSIAHMRGRTLTNSYIIVDECQNTTPNQMLMLLTRIGDNSKFVFTGDIEQHDRIESEMNGLQDLLLRLEKRPNTDFIDVCKFTKDDVQRHAAIPHILELYDK